MIYKTSTLSYVRFNDVESQVYILNFKILGNGKYLMPKKTFNSLLKYLK